MPHNVSRASMLCTGSLKECSNMVMDYEGPTLLSASCHLADNYNAHCLSCAIWEKVQLPLLLISSVARGAPLLPNTVAEKIPAYSLHGHLSDRSVDPCIICEMRIRDRRTARLLLCLIFSRMQLGILVGEGMKVLATTDSIDNSSHPRGSTTERIPSLRTV